LLMWEQKQETGCDVVVPKIGGRIHPLHGIYDRRCTHHVTGLLQSGQYRVKELFNRVKWAAVEEGRFLQQKIDIRFVVNMNTPEEYEEALSLKVHC
ncbi:MAG: molybdenum cofactor guanylyltransferase, partial [Novibacillus thermophilus]